MELKQFEDIARRAYLFSSGPEPSAGGVHPFDERDIHPGFPKKVRKLFDDGHCAEATFEAFKFLDKQIQILSRTNETGFALMMRAFPETSPLVRLTPCTTETERNEQKGFQFIFAGSVLAIRNPRGHEHSQIDAPNLCLDHLGLASMLLRRLQASGHLISQK